MEILIKQKLNSASVLKKIEAFVSSEKMLPVLSCFILFCYFGGFDIFCFTALAFLLVFIFLSNTDIRAGLPPLLFALYAVSLQNGVARRGQVLDASYYLTYGAYIGVLIGIVFAAGAYGIYKRHLKFRLSLGFIGVAAMGFSFLAGGWFSGEYTKTTLLIGGVLAAYFILFFVFSMFIAQTLDFDYIARTVLSGTLIVLCQHFINLIQVDAFSSQLHKANIVLGWGISNNIAPMIAVGLPFAAYYMGVSKSPWYGFTIFILQFVGIVMTLSRAMVLISVPFGIGILIYALIRSGGSARLQLIAAVGVFITGLTIYFWLNWEGFKNLMDYYIEIGLSDRGRRILYEDALHMFSRYPLFGIGANYKLGTWDMYFHMAHNTYLQFMMWSGVVGLIAIAAHTFFCIIQTVYKPNEKRLFLMMGAALLFFHSMLDWMWFFPTCLLYYMMLISAAEYDCIEKTGLGLIWEKKKKNEKRKMEIGGQ